ncbi:hypothetical protein P5V15_002038 [Pogonomyrmex californicus]
MILIRLCKPSKSAEDPEYEDDTPIDEEDEDDEDDESDSTAEAPPQILSHGLSIREQAGNTVKLPCQVIHTENYAVAWMKDGKYLYVEGEPHIEDFKRIVRLPNNTLMIKNASVEDSSNDYKCSILRNPDPIVLTHRLLIDPKRTHQQPIASSTSSPPQHSHKGILRVIPSRRVEVNESYSVMLGCETDIQPSPEIKWFIENKKVNNYDPNIILEDKYITIKNVNESHSGVYQCLAEDGSKLPAVEAITVVVRYKPKIEVEKNIINSGEGMESEITCIVNAYPEATVQWYKDEKKLVHKKGSIMIRHGATKGNKTKHQVKILQTSRHDFGEYRCQAQNILGLDSKSIILTGAPSKAMISGTEVTSDDMGIILKWHLESYSPINEYKLQYRRIGDEKWNVIEPEVKDGKGNQFVVEHPMRELQPGSYEAILTARNTFGWSPMSEKLSFTGEYPPDLALKKRNSATVRSSGTLLALILVVLSCAFTSL